MPICRIAGTLATDRILGRLVPMLQPHQLVRAVLFVPLANSANFCRKRRWAGRALLGIMTRERMSRTKCGLEPFLSRGGGQTTDFEWQTRVVVRKMTGKCQRADNSNARSVKSYDSWASAGSSIGTAAARENGGYPVHFDWTPCPDRRPRRSPAVRWCRRRPR